MINKLQKLNTLILGYKQPYVISRIASQITKVNSVLKVTQKHTDIYDIVFVVYEASRGWILEAICQEIANYFPGKCCFHYSENSLPEAKAYFFSHYAFYTHCLKNNPHIWDSQTFVWYTHPKGIMSDEELIYALNHSTKVISACSLHARLLMKCGLSPEKVTVILGGADPNLFEFHQRGNGAVGLSTAFHARKDPDRVFNIIKLLPHRKFILLGRNWEYYEKFSKMSALPNLIHLEAPYADYPKYYAQMDVYVSPAKLEGGPIPLIETMMCNIVPVASNTGFTADIITHGDNGFIFDVDAPIEDVCELIEKAFEIKTDIRKTVEHLSWKNFSLEIQELIKTC